MSEEAIRVSPRSTGPGTGPGTGAGASGGSPARRPAGGLPVTTELIVMAAVALAVLIAAAVAENFESSGAWTLVTILAAAYILSRGLAKYERPAGEPLD